VSGIRPLPPPSYPDLLCTAYAMGRADGLPAAELEPPDSAAPYSTCCRGRNPADFARHLWHVPGAGPPAGLEINAPLWYAHGFQIALSEVRADRDGSQNPLATGSMQPSSV
jgi:hypothetical protein